MIFFSSDFHFCHKNIVKGTSQWGCTDHCRNFNNPFEMSNLIVDNLNRDVAANDILYFLGDFAFSGTKNYFEWRDKINCKNIHMILGNHDNKHGTVYDPEFNGKKTSSLFSSYQDYKVIYINKTPIILFHYSINSWNHMSGGSIHLFGHSHSLPENRFYNDGRSMDVGVDGNNFKPYSVDEIFEIMKDRPIKKEGHHQW